jgi:antitoxin component YwqK of YwqJK toxin-antitoxin module
METEIRTGKYIDGSQWERSYINNKRHGYSRLLYPNGNIWYETPYKHGLCIGIENSYHQNGTRCSIRTFNSIETGMYFLHGPRIIFKYGN